MKSIKLLIGLALVALILPEPSTAQIGTGPESIMGLGSAETTEFSVSSEESRLSMSRLTSPFLSVLDEDGRNNQAFSLDYTGTGTGAVYHFSLINRNSDFHGTTGISVDAFKLSTHYGTSDGILSSRQDINGISPNFFHGAVSYDYEYGGAALGFSLFDDLMIHAGATFINAGGLEDRSVYYSGFSYKTFHFNFSSVKRADETVGYSLVTGFRLKDYDISYQELNSYYEANWREATIGYTDSENLSTIRLSLGLGNNDLYEAGEESRVALMYSFPLGGDSLRSNRSRSKNELSSKLTSPGMSFNKLRNAGVRAAASGVALSSGDANLDRTPRFRSQHKAAYYVLHTFNPISVRRDREYGSSIYQNRDKTYSPNNFVSVGNQNSVIVMPYYQIPPGTRPTAIWHTHAAYKANYLNEHFSPADIQASIKYDLDGYLGTPLGRMRFFNVETRSLHTFVDKSGSDVVLPH